MLCADRVSERPCKEPVIARPKRPGGSFIRRIGQPKGPTSHRRRPPRVSSSCDADQEHPGEDHKVRHTPVSRLRGEASPQGSLLAGGAHKIASKGIGLLRNAAETCFDIPSGGGLVVLECGLGFEGSLDHFQALLQAMHVGARSKAPPIPGPDPCRCSPRQPDALHPPFCIDDAPATSRLV